MNMNSSSLINDITLRIEIERWPLVTPFRVTGYTWHTLDTILVTLEREGAQGRGEASGVYYRGETATSLAEQIESVRAQFQEEVSRESLLTLLPPGGARCALDCALWDLEAKLTGRCVWQLAGMEPPHPLRATLTCGADEPVAMAAAAVAYADAKAIKLKLTGESSDAARVRAVREARPDVILRVDANQGFTIAGLEELMPVLVEARVELLEQPFPIGEEALLTGFRSPIPVAADESVQCLADMPALVGRFQVVNIKLEKCGGLTEAFAMSRLAGTLGLKTMVGNMLGTSLAMAPGYLLGQICDIVELDGPLALSKDRIDPATYAQGSIYCPESLWGSVRGDRP